VNKSGDEISRLPTPGRVIAEATPIVLIKSRRFILLSGFIEVLFSHLFMVQRLSVSLTTNLSIFPFIYQFINQ